MRAFLEVARVALSLFFLGYASWRDFKTREVNDTVWLIFGPAALMLTSVHIFLYESWQLPWYVLCVGLTSAFAVLIYYSGAFGGADSKALICLALALPFPLRGLFTPLFSDISLIPQIFFPVTVFSNSLVLSASTAVYMFLRNLFWSQRTGKRFFEGEQREEFWGRKLLVLATGYKVPIQKLEEKWHLYPLEDVEHTEQGIKRSLILLPKDQGRDEILHRIKRAVENEDIENKVWATPGLPMLIFITAGLIIGLLLGDIVWTCIGLLFS